MLLLPYEKYNLYTRLSPEEARQRLADNTEQGGKKKPLGEKTVKPFRGQLTNETFSISPIIDYRNSFLPLLNGTYFRENGMTRIRTRLQLNDVVLVFCIIAPDPKSSAISASSLRTPTQPTATPSR